MPLTLSPSLATAQKSTASSSTSARMTGPVAQPRRASSWLQSISSSSKAISASPKDSGRRRVISGLLRRLSSVRSAGDVFGNGTTRERTLVMLPEDVLLEVLACMNVKDVLRIAKVCRVLRNLANTREVWRSQATQLMAIGRPLVLPGFSCMHKLSTRELKVAVLRTVELAEKWSSGSGQALTADTTSRVSFSFAKRMTRLNSYEAKKTNMTKALRALSSEKVNLAFSIPQCLCYIVKFKHFFLPPTRDGQLVGWDIEAEQDLGVYDMTSGIFLDGNEMANNAPENTGTPRRTASGLIFSGRVHYSSRSLYYIVSGGFVSGQEMNFYVLRIQFPSGTDVEDRIQYTRITGFTLPHAYIIEMHILDVNRRMLCVVLLCPSTKTLYLYLVFDWDTKESAILNTGLEYKYRKTVISLRLTENGENVILRSERDGHEVQRMYSLTALRQHSPVSGSSKAVSQVSSLTTHSSSGSLSAAHSITPPISESQIVWSDGASLSLSPPYPNPNLLGMNAQVVAESFAYRVWNMLPWWPTFNDVPYRTSTVVLYWTDHPAPGEQRWTIAQHFATDRGPCPISTPDSPSSRSRSSSSSSPTSPCSSASTLQGTEMSCAGPRGVIGEAEQAVYKRCIVPLRDPVIVPFSDDRVPILGLAYNHVGWIEQVETRRRGRRYKKRVAMLASFPGPGVGHSQSSQGVPELAGAEAEKQEGLKANIRPLDIPGCVLDVACHLIVDSSCATVSITTRDNELYTYRYA